MEHSDVFSVVLVKNEKLFLNHISGKYVDSIHRENFVPKDQQIPHSVRFEVKRAGQIFDEGILKILYLEHEYFTSKKIFSKFWNVKGDMEHCSHCFLPAMFQLDDEIFFHHNSVISMTSLINQSDSGVVNTGKACDEMTFNNLYAEVFKNNSKHIYRFRKVI